MELRAGTRVGAGHGSRDGVAVRRRASSGEAGRPRGVKQVPTCRPHRLKNGGARSSLGESRRLTTSLGVPVASAERPEDTRGGGSRLASPFQRATWGAGSAARGPRKHCVDLLEHSHPFLFFVAPTCPPSQPQRPGGRQSWEVRPSSEVTCIPFHSPTRGNLPLLPNPRGSPLCQPLRPQHCQTKK